MKHRGRIGVGAVVLMAVILCGDVRAEIRKFTVDEPSARNHGVWRLTHDPAIRDEANYHNVQCFSHNGRYTCYTHWTGTKGAGGKGSAEIHVVDLMTGESRLVGKGIKPRWANNSNRLFYSRRTGDGTKLTKTGTEVIRYDADTGEKVSITHGMEWPSGLDSTDAWLFGTQYFRGDKPFWKLVRVRNEPGSALEVLENVPNPDGFVKVNPRHPVIEMRRGSKHKIEAYRRRRVFFDLDGGNMRTAQLWGERSHAGWSGDGKYLLFGDERVRGRLWNEPYPSEVHILANAGSGDISPADKAGRYAVSGGVGMADLRSGDVWRVVTPRSRIIYPLEGDNSTLMCIDGKGSPDGTKIHYHSTVDLENLLMTKATKYDKKVPDVLHVESTTGFPESGDFVHDREVVGYERKTATTFAGLTRGKYGTFPAKRFYHGAVVPLSTFVLSEEDRKRAKPLGPMVAAGFPPDHPLMYQRYTDCYIVVARLPFRPHLRLRDGRMELIPGEHHWETRGYRVLRDGRPVNDRLLEPGDNFPLDVPGAYTAVAVEWSNLESPPSLPLKVDARMEGIVLEDKPADFSRTREVWKVGEKPVSRAEAMTVADAVMEVVHLHDGVIAREQWQEGHRVSRVDFNEAGNPIRHQEFENGRLKKRFYKKADGVLSSEEFFGPDGAKTEYIAYYTTIYPGGNDMRGIIYSHWWFDHGRPTKKIKRYGGVIFDVAGDGQKE